MFNIAMTLAVPDNTGASRMLCHYGRALKRRGHNVVLIHGTPPRLVDGKATSILPEVKASQIETRLAPVLRTPIPPIVYRQVRKHARGCDAVIGFNQRDRAVAVKVAASLGVPSILAIQNQHNFWGPLCLPRLKRRYYAAAVRNHANLLVCASDVPKREAIDWFGVSPERCVVLHNGVNVPQVNVNEGKRYRLRSELGVSPRDRVFVNVGRLDTQKGQDNLVEAWGRLQKHHADSKLLLVGDVTVGSQAARSMQYKQSLLKQISDANLADSIKLLGWRDDVPDILQLADVYVHSARWEGWPLAVAEAMFAKLPIVMTDCSGRPVEFVDGVHGYVVPTDDVASLAGAMELMMKQPETELRAVGEACRLLAERHYDINRTGEKFADLVERVIQGSNRSM